MPLNTRGRPGPAPVSDPVMARPPLPAPLCTTTPGGRGRTTRTAPPARARAASRHVATGAAARPSPAGRGHATPCRPRQASASDRLRCRARTHLRAMSGHAHALVSPLAYGATTDRGRVEPTGTRLPAGGPPADAGPRCGDDRGGSRLSGGAGMSLTDSAQYYHEVLKRIPPRATPAFEDEAMQERVWGRRWGVYDDVGPLRMVLVHRPGDSIRIMTGDHYDPTIEALIDDEQQWYYRDRRAPDLARMQREHDAMVAALQREGVEVIPVEGAPTDPKAMYTRDNAIAVRGGAIICRMGPVGSRPGTGRRGEEAYVARRLASLGMPILRTIHGTGLFEGGSFCFLNETTALAGLSYRQNEEGVRQIEEVLATQGVRLLRVDLPGYA